MYSDTEFTQEAIDRLATLNLTGEQRRVLLDEGYIGNGSFAEANEFLLRASAEDLAGWANEVLQDKSQ